MRRARTYDFSHPLPDDRPGGGILFVLALALTAAAAAFGGASRENSFRLATVELAALPLAALYLRRLATRPLRSPIDRWAFVLLGLILVAPLYQLIPLPPSIWTALPGQSPRVEALVLAHVPAPWLPLSLAPAETAAMALALIPPTAMFLAVLSLNRTHDRRLVMLWIGLAIVGLALGLAQVVSPAGGPAFPYRTTNLGSLVGLFANRNHEAGYLLAILPLAAALATPPARRGSAGEPDERGRSLDAKIWLLMAFIGLSVVALGVIRSRTGVVLAGPALLAALAVAWRTSPGRFWTMPTAGLALVAAVAATAVAVFGLTPVLDRFVAGQAGEIRLDAWPHVLAAADMYQPIGSGLGSFDRVFRSVEPLELVAVTYLNHAHNDYLELWLETGWPGAAILALFLIWLAVRSFAAWRGGGGLAQAASASILLLLAESAVDYPLRTETMVVLFAFCCGLLAARRGDGRPAAAP